MRNDLKCIEFLSDGSERLLWEKEELPPDELCIENAIIMGRFNRYPLVIDPSD
jgi:dynein heavy chain 1